MEAEHLNKEPRHGKLDADKIEDNECNALATLTVRASSLTNMAFTTSHKASMASGATAHVEKVMSVVTRKTISLYISIGTVRKYRIQVATQCESFLRVPGGEKPAASHRELHVSRVKQSSDPS